MQPLIMSRVLDCLAIAGLLVLGLLCWRGRGCGSSTPRLQGLGSDDGSIVVCAIFRGAVKVDIISYDVVVL